MAVSRKKLMVSPFVLTRNVKMQFISQLPTQQQKFERHVMVYLEVYQKPDLFHLLKVAVQLVKYNKLSGIIMP